MDEAAFNTVAGWVTEAGLIGRSESELMSGFCRRVVEAGIPLARAMVILDTLHPIYEGRAFRWRVDEPDVADGGGLRTHQHRRGSGKLANARHFTTCCNRAKRRCGGASSPVIRQIFQRSRRRATRA